MGTKAKRGGPVPDGGPRAGSWVRGEVRRRQWAVIEKMWWLLAVVVAFFVVLGAAGWLLAPSDAGPFFAGICASLAVVTPTWLVIQLSGTANLMMGDTGEQWTAEALGRLDRRAWRTFDHLPLRYGDIDHVLLGADQAVAFETKWSSVPWGLGPNQDERVTAAARQATRASTELARHLRSADVSYPLAVTPLVVLWGPMESGGPSSAVVDGVEIVPGADLKGWLAQLPPQRDPERIAALDAAWTRLLALVEIREAYAAAGRAPDNAFIRLGPYAMLARLGQAMLAGALTFGLGVAALLVSVNLVVWLMATVALGAGSWLVARRIRRPWVCFGGLFGIGALVALSAAIVVLA